MATVKKKAQPGRSIGSYVTKDNKTSNYDALDRFKNEKGEDRYYRSTGSDLYSLGKQNQRKSLMNSADSVRSNTLTPREREIMKSQEMKKSGKVKAKDGKWIQKAVNPKHKGYCTPMTKATCTPKRKALAKTFKAMGRARKGK